jgi:hypothetical protein
MRCIVDADTPARRAAAAALSPDDSSQPLTTSATDSIYGIGLKPFQIWKRPSRWERVRGAMRNVCPPRPG